MNHIVNNQRTSRIITSGARSALAMTAMLVVSLVTFEAQAQYRQPAARDEDWVSGSLPGPASEVRRRERDAIQPRAMQPRTDVALRSEYRDGGSRDGSYDGVAPVERTNRYDAPVDVRYGSNVTSSPSYSTPAQYNTPASYPAPRYNSYSTGATAQATPWRPVGDARAVTSWQVTPADQKPTLNGGYPYYPTSGYPAGYQNRGLGYNNVPLNAPLNNSFPTTQVMPINNIQPMPGYGGYAGPGQFYGQDDFNRNGWNWGSNRQAGWAPLIPIKAPPTNYVVGQGLWGQPKVYIPNQPIRNGIRYILP
jgi:hypothetical protein